MFGFEIEKVKEYDGNNPIERAFMSALIPGQKTSQIDLSVSRTLLKHFWAFSQSSRSTYTSPKL